MTSRERILRSIQHEEPHHVPVDLGSTPSSGISAIAYNNLKTYLNIQKGKTRIYDVVQQLAQPEDEILDRFHIDAVDLGRMFNMKDEDWYDVILSDGSRAQYPAWFRPRKNDVGEQRAYAVDGTEIAIMLPGMNFYDQTCFPYIDDYPPNFKNLRSAMAKVHWAALAHSPWDSAGAPDFWERLRANAVTLREKSSRSVTIVCGCNLFEWGTFLRRIDNFLMDLLLEPVRVEKLLDALLEIHLETLASVCRSVGDVVDIIRFGDDLGTNTGPFMSPDLYRRFFKPRHAVLCDYVKKNSHMHTFLHSCGSIHDLMPDLIEAGFEIINPVQTSSRNMDPATLKREFGRDITFWGGGCDTRRILNLGSVKEVKEHVTERLEIFSKGGGFVFTPVHNILPDVPPQNIGAMFEAIARFNR
ncbi:MAG: uroporphyrinogen decarboxylase family protein [Bacteroidota bacterium]|jgi:uroporphyrinogen decarboxylase